MARNKPNVGQTGLTFDWALVRSFLAVMDAGSLLGAARALNTSQPTIGRHIESLESQLGIDLFERTGRGVLPTQGARLIAEQARQMQLGAEGLSRAVAGNDALERGLIRIAASRMVALHMMPAVIAAIQSELPQVEIGLVSSDEVSNLLRRDADIAVRMIQPRQNTLIARKLGTLPIVPCASRRYLDRWGTPRNLRDLTDHRLIGADRDPGFNVNIARMEEIMDLPPGAIRFSVRSDDFTVQVAAIKAGLGVGFTNEWIVAKDPDLQQLPIDMPLPSLPVWLAVHREIRTSPRIRRVYDLLGEKLKAAIG